MCYEVDCQICGKRSFVDCGDREHLKDLFSAVPVEARCQEWNVKEGERLGNCQRTALSAAEVDELRESEAYRKQEEMQKEIESLQASAPMVGEVEACSVLLPLYEGNPLPGFVEGITNYLSLTFPAGLRRVRGDGNCFYRAFLFSYLEQIIRGGAASAGELMRFKEVIVNSKADLVALGYTECTFEIFVDMLVELVDKVAAGGVTAQEHFDMFQEDNSDCDYYVWYMRLMTSCALKRDAARFEPFIPDPSCATIAEFCSRCVEPMKTECEHLQILALSEYIGVQVHIHYLDGKPCPVGESLQVHKFAEPADASQAASAPTIHLLYRPGHYDILNGGL